MAFLNRAFVVFVLCSVLGEWTNVAAVNEATAIRIVASPTVTKNGSSLSNATSHHMMSTPSHNMSSAMPHNTTVTPHNTTVMPHNMTVTPHNMTVMPHNTTIMPHNTTIMPHNTTIMPHNSTVMPPHNMTITPSSAHTVMPTSSMHPSPTPTPAPKRGNFSVKENNTVCLFAYMAAKFDIMIVSQTLSLKLPTNATVRGECGKSVQEPYIILNWQTMEGYSCNFTIHFVTVEGETLKASTKGRWAAANLTFSLKMSSDAEPVYTFYSARGPLEQVSADYGYAFECRTQPINFKLNANNSNVNVTLTDIDFQPFDVRDGQISNVEKCYPATEPTTPNPQTTPATKSNSHVVPIAVGCSLAALVIIIGVGYMIGRRRRMSKEGAGYRKL